MGILDITLLVCFVPAIVQGLLKGLVKQVIGLVSLVVGVIAASRFSNMATAWLSAHLQMDAKVLQVISFVIIAVLVVLLLNLIGELVTRIIKMASLGLLNRVLGMVFAIVKTALVLGLIIMLFEGINGAFHFLPEEKLANATVYTALRDMAHGLFPYIKSIIANA